MPTEVRRGLVLAGGRSRRMGRDKALLDWQGRPLIEHMIDLLHTVGCLEVRVAGDRPDYAGIPDLHPGGGPLVGLASAAAQLADGELLIVPVDMPRLSPALLRRLFAPALDGWVGFAGVPLPLRLRLDAHSRGVLNELLAAPDGARSLRALLERLPGQALAVGAQESTLLASCNTPEEWALAQRR